MKKPAFTKMDWDYTGDPLTDKVNQVKSTPEEIEAFDKIVDTILKRRINDGEKNNSK